MFFPGKSYSEVGCLVYVVCGNGYYQGQYRLFSIDIPNI